MITIPNVLTYKDIAVYPDDMNCNVFYCIRTTPRIRMESDGTPVFSGLFYTDKADNSLKSTSGIAGALINFDVNLAITEDEYKEISNKLKESHIQEARVRAIKKKNDERLYYRTRISGNTENDPTGYEIPEVEETIRFGSIDFKSGTVELLEEAKGDFVAYSSAGGPCSGFADNNAAFALRLSDLGGAVWYKALQQQSKAIGIRYKLTFDVRIPCLEMRIYAASHQKSDITRDVERIWKNVDKGCTDADVERIDCKSVTQTLVDESVINIEIIQGSSELPQDDVNRIRESMMSLLQAKIEEIIKSKIQGMTREQMEKSMIEKMVEEIDSFTELRFTQDTAIEWSVAPQGTIMDFMHGLSADKVGRVMTLVDLADAVRETGQVVVQAVAPWDDDPKVTAIDVELEYGTTGIKKGFTLTKDAPKETWFFRVPLDSKGKAIKSPVRYKAYVHTFGKTETYELPSRETHGNVFINVPKIGVADVTFVPHPSLYKLEGNNQVTGVTIHTRYRTREERLADDADRRKGIVNETQRGILRDFTLDPEKAEVDGARFYECFGVPLDEPLLYEVEYSFKNRAPIKMPVKQFYITEGSQAQLVIPTPFGDSLEIPIEVNNAFKKNKDILFAFVTLKYVDEENNFESSYRMKLEGGEEEWEASGEASLVVLDKTKNKYSYQYRLEMTDSSFVSEWMEGEGESTPIILRAPEAFTVDTGMLGIAGKDYYRGKLEITFENEGVPALNYDFDKNNARELRYWYLPKGLTGDQLKYSYKFDYWDKRGKHKEFSGSDTGSLLMIVMPEEPEAPAAPAPDPAPAPDAE